MSTEHGASGVLDDLDDLPPVRRHRTITLAVIAAIAVAIAVIAALVNQGDQHNAAAQNGGQAVIKLNGPVGAAPVVGQPAPEFQVITTDGKTLKLSDLRGKSVWLTFGASWCSGCQVEAPDVQTAAQKWAGQGVEVVGINISEDTAAAKAYAQRIGLTYRIAADPEDTVAKAYAVNAIPASYFIDKAGVVREIRPSILTPAQMDDVLTRLTKA